MGPFMFEGDIFVKFSFGKLRRRFPDLFLLSA
jgi:hypothetical protein